MKMKYNKIYDLNPKEENEFLFHETLKAIFIEKSKI
jgi:hypothetical protein